jgi:hypothetical protein
MLRREQVHAPTATAGAAGFAAEQLGEELSGRNAFGEGVSMPAVRAEDDVGAFKMRTDPDSNRFLPDVGMTRAVNQPPLMRPGKLLFALANELHVAVECQKHFTIEIDFNHSGHAVSLRTEFQTGTGCDPSTDGNTGRAYRPEDCCAGRERTRVGLFFSI